MTLLAILLATLAGGLLSVLLAGSLALTVLRRHADHLVSFAVGALLAAAFLGMLPHAQEAGLSPGQTGGWVLIGLLAFFLLEKAALWRHNHGEGAGNCALKATVPMVVIGDGLHNFVDGVAIAAAFLADTHLGIATAAAILLHEIPQELADFMVLLAAGLDRRRALLLNLLSGTSMIAGGVLGYFLLGDAQSALPVVLALAAASFIYIAISDLVPHLQRQYGLRNGLAQVLLIGMGASALLLGGMLSHAH